jgi:hypothetical protein
MSPRFFPLSSHSTNDESPFISEGDTALALQTKIWNIGSLKNQVNRLIMSSYKKMGKVTVEPASSTNSPIVESTNEEVSSNFKDLQSRHEKLLQLESLLQSEATTKGILSPSVIDLILELEIKAGKAVTQKPPTKKSVTKRLPYRRYYTRDQTEIRVSINVDHTANLKFHFMLTSPSRLVRLPKITMNYRVHQNIEMPKIGGCMPRDVLGAMWLFDVMKIC